MHDATERGSWAFGYVAYEAAAGLDPQLPGGAAAPGGPPLVWFGLCDEPAPVDPVTAPPAPEHGPDAWSADWTDEEHARAVETVREHIAAGETYQCNVTDRLRTTLAGDPEDLYRRLALAQRGAYNAYLDLGRHVVASASPELFFEWTGDVVRTRPMKGTARRGRTTSEDLQQSAALRASSKEQAENLMIVDLLRNDLGRVAETGSVVVDELFALERYPTVWQLTSQVSARVRPGTGLLDLFRALFPCGSVTGAPKRRTMQLIEELEPTPRGVYCGAVGLVAPPTASFRARFNVAIRTVVVDRGTGRGGVRGRGRHHLGLRGGRGTRGGAREGRRPGATTSPSTGCWRPWPSSRATGLRHLDRHLARMADSADWTGFRFDRAAVLAALDDCLARPLRAGADPDPGVAGRPGRRRGGAAAPDQRPARPARAGRRPGGRHQPVAAAQDDPTRRLPDEGPAAPGGRRRRPGQPGAAS